MLPETLVNEVIKQICKSLASFDLKTRNRGFKRLQKVISFCNTGTYNLELEHCLLIWKGLHYWLWSQDKLINQERLVDDICKLLSAIQVPKTKFEFINAFLETQVREWRTLDKWRTDKFMMLLRRFFVQILNDLSNSEWTNIDKLIDLLKLFLITPDGFDPAFSLRLHFATIYLEEVFKFELNSELWMKFLIPYFELVPQMPRDNGLLKRVEDIFFLILPPTEEEDEKPLNIDFGELGQYLYRLGGTGGKNTKKLYEWSTICFGIAGISPPTEPPPPPVDPPIKSKQKRKRKLNPVSAEFVTTNESSNLASPPRKKRKTENSTPSKSTTKRKKLAPVHNSETASKTVKSKSSPSPDTKSKSSTPPVRKSKSPTSPSPKSKPLNSTASKLKSPATPVTLSNTHISPVKAKSQIVTPKEKNKRVSFGKIYRKPFKKKDAVRTPSPGSITSSAAGKGILKKNLLRQSKKLGLLFR